MDFLTEMVLSRFKKVRKMAGVSQQEVADKVNQEYGTTYTKAAISGYENLKYGTSLERAIFLCKCVGLEMNLSFKESINPKFNRALSTMPEKEKEALMKLINTIHVQTTKEGEYKAYLSNYINKYVDVIMRKGGFSLIFEDTQRYDYDKK